MKAYRLQQDAIRQFAAARKEAGFTATRLARGFLARREFRRKLAHHRKIQGLIRIQSLIRGVQGRRLVAGKRRLKAFTEFKRERRRREGGVLRMNGRGWRHRYVQRTPNRLLNAISAPIQSWEVELSSWQDTRRLLAEDRDIIGQRIRYVSMCVVLPMMLTHGISL